MITEAWRQYREALAAGDREYADTTAYKLMATSRRVEW